MVKTSAVLVVAVAGCAIEPIEPMTEEIRDEVAVCAVGDTVRGIDVSKFQGTIDWPTVKASGIDFAFIRVSDGFSRGVDPFYAANWSQAAAAGVLRGTYQFFRPDEDPVAQANLLLANMGTLGPDDLPPVIDVEVTTAGMTPELYTELIGAWIERVQTATGVRPLIYAGRLFWNGNVQSTKFNEYPLWIPNFGATCPNLPEAWNNWSVFQSSNTGTVPGIIGAVDTDVFNGSLAALQALGAAPTCGDGVCNGIEDPDSCRADCLACEVPFSGRVVEETDRRCFVPGGPARFLRNETTAGNGGTLSWTRTTAAANEGNNGQWNLYFQHGGQYRVRAYTAAAFAQSTQARYVVRHDGVDTTVIVDQTATDGWTRIGDFTFAKGGHQWVHLGDNSGEAGVQIVFDALHVTSLPITH